MYVCVCVCVCLCVSMCAVYAKISLIGTLECYQHLPVPQSQTASTSTCISEVTIGVVVTILIEGLLAVPIIAVILALWLKRRYITDKSDPSKISRYTVCL